jgi:DHA2 family methylenomycin A resistance protein-like MFS transporter
LIFVLSLFFQRTEKYTALQTGLAFLPMTVVILPANLASGRLATRVGPRMPMVVGQVLMMIGCVGLVWTSEGMPYSHLAVQMRLLGAGIGLTVPALTSALLGTVDDTESGIASGVLNAARQAGSVVGVALFGTSIGHQPGLVPGLRLALLVAAGILLPSALLAFRMLPREKRA